MSEPGPHKLFNYLEKKILVFFVFAILLVVTLFVAVGYKQDYFTRTTTLYIFSDDATGIRLGMAVKILGFSIGTVQDISIEPNATVRVKLTIQSDYMRFVTLGASTRLVKEGIIGESIIEIIPGNQESRQVANNGVLPFKRGLDLTEIAGNLYGEVQPILQGIGKTMASINNPDGDVQQTLHNVNRTSKELRSLSETLASRVPSLLGKTDSISSRVNDISTRVNDSLPAMIDSSIQSLENVRAATNDIRNLTATSAQEIPQTLQDGRALVKDSLSVVNGVKSAWPVRNMLAPPHEQPIQVDSYVQPPPAR